MATHGELPPLAVILGVAQTPLALMLALALAVVVAMVPADCKSSFPPSMFQAWGYATVDLSIY